MDPTTTLVAFLLQTHPSVQSVQLIGSWDNFSTCYTMKRDVRRGPGQWRGCYSFKDIVCDDVAGNRSPRNGGLKMGATYYYYYEVDGSTEMHDPTEPWTTSCPYLPGQAVNTLVVPVEQTLRQRSASLNSMRPESFRTMDPEAKFAAPRPVPVSPDARRRLGSASTILQKRPPSRSPSPAPSWKRFFTRRLASRDSDLSSTGEQLPEAGLLARPFPDQTRRSTPSEGSQTKDISPDSLRRFLSEDAAGNPQCNTDEPLPLSIPDEVGDEADGDDNFATSAISENQVYATCPSPPPFQRSTSLDTVPAEPANASLITLTVGETLETPSHDGVERNSAPTRLSRLETNHEQWPLPAASSALATPIFPQLVEDDPSSLYDSNDEDDLLSSTESDNLSCQPVAHVSFASQAFNYSLPQHGGKEKTMVESSPAMNSFNSPQLLAGTDSGSVPDSGTNFLRVPIDTGLDDFISEMGWIVEAIGGGHDH